MLSIVLRLALYGLTAKQSDTFEYLYRQINDLDHAKQGPVRSDINNKDHAI